jgi:hypothetical protein
MIEIHVYIYTSTILHIGVTQKAKKSIFVRHLSTIFYLNNSG